MVKDHTKSRRTAKSVSHGDSCGIAACVAVPKAYTLSVKAVGNCKQVGIPQRETETGKLRDRIDSLFAGCVYSCLRGSLPNDKVLEDLCDCKKKEGNNKIGNLAAASKGKTWASLVDEVLHKLFDSIEGMPKNAFPCIFPGTAYLPENTKLMGSYFHAKCALYYSKDSEKKAEITRSWGAKILAK